jgi:hypothetical protein
MHRLPPALEGGVERFLTWRLTARRLAGLGAQAGETGVLGVADDIVEVELGGKVSLAVVGVLAADVVGVEG